MSDRFDELMRAASDEAQRGIDYDAMRAAIMKRAEAQKRRLRTNVIRYGSIAAVAAVAVIAGAVLLTKGGLTRQKSAAPESSMMYAEGSTEDIDGFSLEDAVSEESIAVTSEVPEAAQGADENDRGVQGSSSAPLAGAEYGDGNAALAPGELCGGVCGLYWVETGFELPGIYFGTSQNVSSDASAFVCTVADCTDEDFDNYVAELDAWYPANEDTPKTTNAPGYPRVFTRITEDGCQLRAELAEDGTFTLTAAY